MGVFGQCPLPGFLEIGGRREAFVAGARFHDLAGHIVSDKLGDLPRGAWRALDAEEVAALHQAIGRAE